jgi:hemolysin type calcium-binding protein
MRSSEFARISLRTEPPTEPRIVIAAAVALGGRLRRYFLAREPFHNLMFSRGIVVSVLASLLLTSSSASAALVTAELVRSNWIEITFTAQRGEENRVTFRSNAEGEVVLTDSRAPLSAAGMCERRGLHLVACSPRRTVEARVTLGDRDDRFRTDLAKHQGIVEALGGQGMDRLSTAGSRFEAGLALLGGVLRGGPGTDELELSRIGGEGLGGGGSDHIRGGASFDRLLGGPGRDRIEGRGGGDRLRGEGGRDRLTGGAGPDVVAGGSGDDHISGGAGDDGNGRANVWLSGGPGDDVVHGRSGNDLVLGGAGEDRLYGESGNDWLTGAAGDDLARGAAGNDSLVGSAGADDLGCSTGVDEALPVRRSTPFVDGCEQVVFGFFSVSAQTLSFGAPPVFTGSGLTYATVCGDFHRGCKFDLTLVNTTGRMQETLAYAQVDLPAGQADDEPVQVTVPLDEEASATVQEGIALTTVVTRRNGKLRGSFEALMPGS